MNRDAYYFSLAGKRRSDWRGETVVVFREDAESEETPSNARITLLRACTLLFLFKGMATSSAPHRRETAREPRI